MNDGQLAAFLAIADAGSITAAARTQFISQQALTKRLHSLETELGYPLFSRSREGVRLTDAGRAFYEDAVQLMAIRERALARRPVKAARTSVRISCRNDAPTMVLGRACERCRTLYPDVEQIIVPLGSNEQLEATATGAIDVTEWPDSTLAQERGLAFTPLVDSPHVCMVRRQHPLARASSIELADLEGLAVTMLERGRCRNADRLRQTIERDYPRIALLPSQFDASQRLMGTAKDLVIITPRIFAENNLDKDQVLRPLSVDVYVTIGLVHRAERPSNALSQFIDAARQAWGEG